MTTMMKSRGTSLSLLRVGIVVSFLLLDPFDVSARVRAEGEHAIDEATGVPAESEPAETTEGAEVLTHFDDDFLRKYTLDVDYEDDCRDITDTFLNCTEQKENGLCDPNHPENDMMQVPTVCPATCGTCTKPPTRTSVWVDQVCYDYSEDIHVFFANTDPQPDDFIGIFAAYRDIFQLETVEQSEMWLFACGNIGERCRSASGGIIFGERGLSPYARWTHFPLNPGRYKAALMRYNGTVLAESPPFTAKPEDHACAWECKDGIFPDSSCYEKDDTIHFSFENCAARNDDRIAIYPSSSSTESPDAQDDEPLLWLDACFTQDCMGDVRVDYVSFGSTATRHLIQGKEVWPLPPGEYMASLIRMGEGGGPHGRKIVDSEAFEVLDEGDSCYRGEEEL